MRTGSRGRGRTLSHRLLKGTERRRRHDARRIADADPDERLNVSIKLRRKRGHPTLPDQLYWSKTPPGKRTFLSRDEFADQYGADSKDLGVLLNFAKANKLRVIASSLARRTIVVSGSVKQMNRIFRVDLGIYAFPGGAYRGREGRIYVPSSIAHIVVGVWGLDNRQAVRRHTVTSQDTPAGAVALTPPQVGQLYNFKAGRGAGQTIGILEFGGGYVVRVIGGIFKMTITPDVDAFFQSVGLAVPKITPVPVDGVFNDPGNPLDPYNPSGEVLLDIDVAGSIAPEAHLAVYFAPNSVQGTIDAFSTAVHDAVNQPSVITMSWGGSEFSPSESSPNWNQSSLDAMSEIFAEAASMGISILASSGDDGANCEMSDGAAHVLYPASDPWVTGCGGTIITNVDGLHFDENTWNDKVLDPVYGFIGGATGGGFSRIFTKPKWQQHPKSMIRFPRRRGVPDIAGNGSPYSGYKIFVFGQAAQIGGTSAVAPLYAGFIATLNARLGFNLGYLNPSLYQAKLFPNVFRDIDDGRSNAVLYLDLATFPVSIATSPGFRSGAGWDACTGLGVINGAGFIERFIPAETAVVPPKKDKK